MNKIILIIVMSLLIASEVFAANSKGQYRVYTYKALGSCGVYVSNRRKGLTIDINGWIRGYMSAVNHHVRGSGDHFGSTDPESVMLWVENWCMKNPTRTFLGGLTDLLKTKGAIR